MKPDTPNKILLVDDTLTIIDFLKDLLLSGGYQVYIATSGEKALQIADNIVPDLILLDILMPGIDGYQTCMKLKDNVLFRNTPVIIMSALNEPFDKVKAFNAGASDYISKPVETEELFARISTHLRLYAAQKQLLESNLQLENRVLERTRELLLAKEKAEESDRLKSAFLANISHEIRTPLNGILGFSELVASTDLPADKRLEYIHTIAECGEKLLKTVDDILDLSKLQAHIHKLDLSNVKILPLLSDLKSLFSPIAQLKNIELLSDIEGVKDEFTIHTDAAKLRQMLSILIENAIKFTEKGYVLIGCSLEDKGVKFYVSDTGVGIEKEMIGRMFENFRQAEEDFSRTYGGTGVGLAICKGLVDLLGGTIDVESTPGEGTSFFIRLFEPGQKKEPTITEFKHVPVITDCNKFQILVAEDEEANFLFINEVFAYSGNIEIQHALTGKMAVEIVQSGKHVNLILMDIKMPEMDGLEAMAVIKKLKPNLPVIALTAYASEEDRLRFLHAGFDNYFAKPVKAADLLAFVNTYIQ